jgi:hypothetical protein
MNYLRGSILHVVLSLILSLNNKLHPSLLNRRVLKNHRLCRKWIKKDLPLFIRAKVKSLVN